MDNRLIVFFVVLLSAGLAMVIGTSIGIGDFSLPFIVIAALVILLLTAVPHLSAFLAIAFYASWMTAPGLPGQFGLYYVSCTALAVCAFLSVVFQKKRVDCSTLPHWLLIAFCSIVLFTGLYRGLGFQFLGSHMWGGFFYVQLLMAGLLVFTLPLVNMPANWWPKAMLIMGLLAPLPLIADLLVLKGISFGVVRLFLMTGATLGDLLEEQTRGEGMGRLTAAGHAAQSMIVGYLAIVHTKKLFSTRSLPAILVLTGIFVLSLLSGFRLMTGMLVMVILLAAFLQKTITAPRVVLTAVIVSLILVVLYNVSSELPHNVQRTISWIPGIDISNTARRDAEGTITWRLDLWREAIRLIPDYFWIGQGLAYDSDLFLASKRGGYAAHDSLNWALVTGAYHNGYLSLLIGLGIFGFLTGLPLLILVVVRHIRINWKAWRNARLHQCHQALLASETSWVLVYLTVYGDVTAVFPQFLFMWAAMEAIRKCDDSLSTSIVVTESLPKNDHAYIE